MDMRWHLFSNSAYMNHVEKIRAAKAEGTNVWIPYEPDLSNYSYSGDIVFDISEGLGYLAFPESLLDCMFSVSISDYESGDYKKISWVSSPGTKKIAIYPTDILVLDKLCVMYGTGTMEDSIGCQIPFQIYKMKDLKILLDMVVDLG